MEDHCNARAERNSDSIQIKPSGPKASMRQKKALQLGTTGRVAMLTVHRWSPTTEDGSLLDLS